MMPEEPKMPLEETKIPKEERKIVRIKSPRIDTREYAWSSKLKHRDIQLFGKKTLVKNSHIWGQALMDRPMLKGKHVWK